MTVQYAQCQSCRPHEEHVIVLVTGPRGGATNFGVTLAEALMLRERLDDAIAAFVQAEQGNSARIPVHRMACARCATLFNASRDDAHYCTDACRQAEYRERMRRMA